MSQCPQVGYGYLKVTFELSLTRKNVHIVYAKILKILLDVGKCHLQDQLENYIENFFCQITSIDGQNSMYNGHSRFLLQRQFQLYKLIRYVEEARS